MGSSYLDLEDTEKAVRVFEDLLEENSKLPAAWIGRAFAHGQKAINTNDEYNDELIMGFIEKGLTLLGSDNSVYHDSIHCLAIVLYLKYYNHQINLSVDSAIKAREASEQAASQAATAMLGALVGGAVGSMSNSRMLKGVGYSAAGVGAVSAVSQGNSSLKLDAVGEGAFSIAIKLTILSVPIVAAIRDLELQDDFSGKVEVTSTLESWQKTVHHLFDEQTKRIDSLVSKLVGKLKSAQKAYDYFKDSTEINEVSNLIILADEIGLDDHESFKVLKNIEDRIKEVNRTEGFIARLKTARNIEYGFGAILLLLIAIYLLGGYTVESSAVHGVMVVVFFLIAALSGIYRSSVQRKLIRILKDFQKKKRVFEAFTPSDFKLSKIGLNS